MTVLPIHEPPTTKITSAVDGDGNPLANSGEIVIEASGVHRASSITFTFTVDSTIAIDHFECSLDGNSFSPCTSPQTFNNLLDAMEITE